MCGKLWQEQRSLTPSVRSCVRRLHARCTALAGQVAATMLCACLLPELPNTGKQVRCWIDSFVDLPQ